MVRKVAQALPIASDEWRVFVAGGGQKEAPRAVAVGWAMPRALKRLPHGEHAGTLLD